MEKSPDAFRTISEVADDLDVPQHMLRFWESRFPQIKPLKRGGGRRYYRPDDITLIRSIRRLLYEEGYTIRGVQRMLKEQGPRMLAVSAPAGRRQSAAGRSSAELEGDVLLDGGEDEGSLSARPDRTDIGEPAGGTVEEAGERSDGQTMAHGLRSAVPYRPAWPDAAAQALETALAELDVCRQLLLQARDLRPDDELSAG